MDVVPNGSSEHNALVASGYTHIAEFAVSGRSTCKTCGEKIEQGHLRIGTFKLGKPNEWWPEWRHESCQGLLQIHQTLGADIVKLFIHEDFPLSLRKALSERFATDATCGAASGDAAMGERMSLLDRSTYKRPVAEVLPLITPAAARARDLYGYTPLHLAACHSSKVAVVQALLAAYPEAATARNGYTPLHMAASNRSSVAVVQALLAAYPEAAKATDTAGRTPAELAARYNHNMRTA